MKIKDLIKDLSKYNGNVDVCFRLVPNIPEATDTDAYDTPVKYMGEIDTSLLDAEKPALYLGFKEF